MASIWDTVKQTAGNTVDKLGTALGIKEMGISERIAGGTPTTNTGVTQTSKDAGLDVWRNTMYPSNPTPAPGGGGGSWDAGGQVQGASTENPAPSVDTGRYNELKTIADKGDLNPSQRTEWEAMKQQMKSTIDNGEAEQRAAAKRAAEARRKAAEARYGAQKGIAEEAKGMAKKSYDWLVETLGSNKKDLLSQVALQEKQGVEDYQIQEEKTRKQYDTAKQEILSTYRDLQLQQEKILRGSGMSSSSRSQEAALKLSNLLGKDLSTVRTNEADSLAMIGNALTRFQENVRQTNIGIEREADQKLSKAALDYDQQVKSINANLTLSAAEKEEAYYAAEEQLARDSQGITQWATGLKLQAQQAQAAMTNQMDDFIANMLDENGMLNAGLTEKEAATNEILTKNGYSQLTQNPTTTDPTVGVYQAKKTYGSKEELDAALQRGEIDMVAYQQQLPQVQMSATPITAIAQTTNPLTLTGQTDNLQRALFA